MMAQFTRIERRIALALLVAFSIVGLLMAAAGRHDPIGVHGALVTVLAVIGSFAVISGYYEPLPTTDRFRHYNDDPSKFGIVAAMIVAFPVLGHGTWHAYRAFYRQP